jgi:hypothetical protein
MTGFFVIVEIPGDADYDVIAFGHSLSGGGGMAYGESFSHGWPCEYLFRNQGACSSKWIDVPWIAPRAWNFFSDSQSREFSSLHAILDVAVCLAIMAAVAIGFEWRRRRRTRLFQFTLRELLLLMLLTAIALSWWRMHHDQRVREQAIVSQFQKDPYSVNWSDEKYRGPTILARVFGKNSLSDFWSYTNYYCSLYDDRQEIEKHFSSLKEFPAIETIECGADRPEESFMTDELLGRLASLENIRRLELQCAKITDAGMETISHFRKLRQLNVYQTAVTSAGVQYLKATPLLEDINLSKTQIDDAAAETLARLDNLMFLRVSDTKLADKSIPFLGRLSHLLILDISGTQISYEGYQKLKAMLPDCRIEWAT